MCMLAPPITELIMSSQLENGSRSLIVVLTEASMSRLSSVKGYHGYQPYIRSLKSWKSDLA